MQYKVLFLYWFQEHVIPGKISENRYSLTIPETPIFFTEI